MMKVMTARKITIGTKILEILSATCSMGAFGDACASWTSWMMRDSVVSAPTLIARMYIVDDMLIVAEITSSPSFLRTGTDSPVIMDSSVLVEPRQILPAMIH